MLFRSIDFISNYADRTKELNYYRPEVDKEYEQNKERKYMQVSHHWTDSFDGKAKEFLDKAFAIMFEGNHDNSDIMTDYFDVGWYIDVNIGKWDKPYEFVA